VLLGKERGQGNNVWDVVKPPLYEMISSDPLEKTVVDIHIEEELINAYESVFYFGFKLEHINGKERWPSSRIPVSLTSWSSTFGRRRSSGIRIPK